MKKLVIYFFISCVLAACFSNSLLPIKEENYHLFKDDNDYVLILLKSDDLPQSFTNEVNPETCLSESYSLNESEWRTLEKQYGQTYNKNRSRQYTGFIKNNGDSIIMVNEIRTKYLLKNMDWFKENVFNFLVCSHCKQKKYHMITKTHYFLKCKGGYKVLENECGTLY